MAQKVFLANSVWGGSEQKDRFLKEGIWENKSIDTFRRNWEQVDVNDILILGHTDIEGNDVMPITTHGFVEKVENEILKVKWVQPRRGYKLNIGQDSSYRGQLVLLERDQVDYLNKTLSEGTLKALLSDYLKVGGVYPVGNGKAKLKQKATHLKHALSIEENDQILVDKGYQNQGLIGYLFRATNESRHRIIQGYFPVRDEFITYLNPSYETFGKLKQQNNTALGHVSLVETKKELAFHRFSKTDNPLDELYCTNPDLESIKRLGYEKVDKGFVGTYLTDEISEDTIPLYVYSTMPGVKLFQEFGETDTQPMINKLSSAQSIKKNVLSQLNQGAIFWWYNHSGYHISNDPISVYLNRGDDEIFRSKNGQFALGFNNNFDLEAILFITGITKTQGLDDVVSSVTLVSQYSFDKPLGFEALEKEVGQDLSNFRDSALNILDNDLARILLEVSGILDNSKSKPNGQLRDKIPFHIDVVAQEDKLGREPVAKAFVDLIKKDVFTENMNHAFMVHLEGEWGAGKSTFLNLIKKQLNEGDEEWIIIDYNAWQNQHITPPWWTLIDQIYRQTRAGDSFGNLGKLSRAETWRRVKLYSGWQKVIAILLTLIITSCLVLFGNSIVDYIMEIPFFKGDKEAIETGSIIGVFSKLFLTLASLVTIIFTFSKLVSSSFFMNSSDEANSFMRRSADPMSRIKLHFGGLVDNINSKKKKRQLAIFIDDIDRCNRDFIIQLLEGIQTLFREKRVLYIVAGDKNWISTSFEKTYGEFASEQSTMRHNLGDLFLEKAFQLSLRMPNISNTSKEEYWSHILGIAKSKEEGNVEIEQLSTELKEEVEKELETSAEDITTPEFIQKFEKKHNLSSNAASSLIIEKKNESNTEIRHLLKDLHNMVETNPRAIIRLANNYTMTRSTLIAERKNVNPENLLRWLIIKDLYPMVRSKFNSKTREEFEKALENDVTDEFIKEKCLQVIRGQEKSEALTMEEMKTFEGI